MLTQMFSHFWLLFTLNNTRQCSYQSKTVNSFWPVNVLTRYTLASISTFWLILTLVVVGWLIPSSILITLQIFKIDLLKQKKPSKRPATPPNQKNPSKTSSRNTSRPETPTQNPNTNNTTTSMLSDAADKLQQDKGQLSYLISHIQACDFRIFLQISLCLVKFSWKNRSSHQGKKEVACIVSQPLVSCLWGCGESVNPPKSRKFRGLCPLLLSAVPTIWQMHPYFIRTKWYLQKPIFCYEFLRPFKKKTCIMDPSSKNLRFWRKLFKNRCLNITVSRREKNASSSAACFPCTQRIISFTYFIHLAMTRYTITHFPSLCTCDAICLSPPVGEKKHLVATQWAMTHRCRESMYRLWEKKWLRAL